MEDTGSSVILGMLFRQGATTFRVIREQLYDLSSGMFLKLASSRIAHMALGEFLILLKYNDTLG